MKEKITKLTAIKLAKAKGIKFSGSFHADCSTSQAEYLAELARKAGYRKPRLASGSTGRYFYYHLYRKYI